MPNSLWNRALCSTETVSARGAGQLRISVHCGWKCWEWRNVSRKCWCQLAVRATQGARFHAEDWTTCSGLYHGRFPRAWIEVYARLDGACPSGLAWPHWWWQCCRSLPSWQHVGRLNPCPGGRWSQSLFDSSTSSGYLAAASQIASALEQALYNLLFCFLTSELSHVL